MIPPNGLVEFIMGHLPSTVAAHPVAAPHVRLELILSAAWSPCLVVEMRPCGRVVVRRHVELIDAFCDVEEDQDHRELVWVEALVDEWIECGQVTGERPGVLVHHPAEESARARAEQLLG